MTEKYDDRPDNKSTDNNNSSNKMRVNRSTFHWLIDSWFMHEGGQLHAEKLIKRMQELHERGSSNFRPSPRKRHALVVAWSRSGEPDRAEASLYGFDKDEPPSASSYNAVVDAYAKSGRPDAVDKAENVVRRMHSKNSKVVPNTSTYNSLLNAYAKSGRPDAAYKAEETLERMIDGSAGPDASPDVTSFSTVVHAWARSHNFGKAEHALKVMDKMSEVATGCSPNVIVVNAVMNACAFTRDNELEGGRALEIAHRMLQRLDGHKSKLRPDDVTYGTYLKVCANHMPDDDDSEEKLRKRVSEAVFKRCCRDGQVGELVLQQLRTLVKDDEGYRRLTGTNRDDPLELLPEEWRCNVRERKSRRI